MSVVGSPGATLRMRPIGTSKVGGLSGTLRLLLDRGQRDEAGPQPGEFGRRQRRGEFSVDLFDRGPDDHGRGPATFGELDVEASAVVRIHLALEVSAKDERVDELAGRLAAYPEAPDHVDRRAAEVGHTTEDEWTVAGKVLEPGFAEHGCDRVAVAAPGGSKQYGYVARVCRCRLGGHARPYGGAPQLSRTLSIKLLADGPATRGTTRWCVRGRSVAVKLLAVRHIVILGRGGAGKSTLAKRLAVVTGIPAIELDTLFWRPGLQPSPPSEWRRAQEDLIGGTPQWILDGDLGPYDVPEPRLRLADTVVVLDFSLPLVVWRSLRRSTERFDYWWWVLRWRRKSRTGLFTAIAEYAPGAEIHVLRHPRDVDRFLAQIAGHPEV